MPTTLEYIADHLPQLEVEDVVRRFSATVEIRDALAFAAELQAFVYERLGRWSFLRCWKGRW